MTTLCFGGSRRRQHNFITRRPRRDITPQRQHEKIDFATLRNLTHNIKHYSKDVDDTKDTAAVPSGPLVHLDGLTTDRDESEGQRSQLLHRAGNARVANARNTKLDPRAESRHVGQEAIQYVLGTEAGDDDGSHRTSKGYDPTRTADAFKYGGRPRGATDFSQSCKEASPLQGHSSIRRFQQLQGASDRTCSLSRSTTANNNAAWPVCEASKPDTQVLDIATEPPSVMLKLRESDTQPSFQISHTASWLDWVFGIDSNSWMRSERPPSTTGEPTSRVDLLTQARFSGEHWHSNLSGSSTNDKAIEQLRQSHHTQVQPLAFDKQTKLDHDSKGSQPKPYTSTNSNSQESQKEDSHRNSKSSSEDLVNKYTVALAYMMPQDDSPSTHSSSKFLPFTLTEKIPVHGPSLGVHATTRSEGQSSYATARGNDSVHGEMLDATIGVVEEEEISVSARIESSSFEQREIELQSVDKRFGPIIPWQQPATQVVSRFREDFGETGKEERKRSLLISRVHSSVSGRARTFSSARIGREAHQGKVAASRAPPSPSAPQGHYRHGMSRKTHPQISRISLKSALQGYATALKHRFTSLEGDHLGGISSKPSVLRSNNSVIRTGSFPQQTFDTQSDELLHRNWRKPAVRLATSPESWVRYPSYSRTQRNQSAALQDQVLYGRRACPACIARTAEDDREKSRSASHQGRASHLIKLGFGKLLPSKWVEKDSERGTLQIRRDSSRLRPDTQYPELEMLTPSVGYLPERVRVEEGFWADSGRLNLADGIK
ncbi:uncharacterized protein F5Z01DRAFT_633603 [Emericellopsis atlantica]|uniref:Uncharacterized protein n=1 Tax=Emericellopsis atlantica TaxID=2614577 RepID=A0A9P7ZTW1_9HYPO|nr:uncharacterized protein F5Z01DRAFT_633603 [Emericellopsis atlantica]KAG9257687.1 hypothetical protein F5Z01DRAFT_633603 [Emericellopsis atlantica]